jgi:2-oxoglutarate/2-oxoacid ferredoxin oxidoreductase subunit beta
MTFKDFINYDKFPVLWCGGCGIMVVMNQVAKVFDEFGFSKDNVSVISGIGCTGRVAGYFALDSVHTCHGRAVAVAEGVKRGNPNMNVLVFSGDGDLLGIGLQHLIHTARRGVDMTVVCVNNSIYAMTGGQLAPTSCKGKVTVTSPEGSESEPIDAFNLLKGIKGVFYARTTSAHLDHVKDVVSQAVKHKGFSFVEVRTHCFTNDGSQLGMKNGGEVAKALKEEYSVGDLSKDTDLGVSE